VKSTAQKAKLWHPYGVLSCECCLREWPSRVPHLLEDAEKWPQCCELPASLLAPLVRTNENEEADYALWRCVPCMKERSEGADIRAWLGLATKEAPLCRYCSRPAEILTPLSLLAG